MNWPWEFEAILHANFSLCSCSPFWPNDHVRQQCYIVRSCKGSILSSPTAMQGHVRSAPPPRIICVTSQIMLFTSRISARIVLFKTKHSCTDGVECSSSRHNLQAGNASAGLSIYSNIVAATRYLMARIR